MASELIGKFYYTVGTKLVSIEHKIKRYYTRQRQTRHSTMIAVNCKARRQIVSNHTLHSPCNVHDLT